MTIVKVIPLTKEQLTKREQLRRAAVVADNEASLARHAISDYDLALAGSHMKSREHYKRSMTVVDDCVVITEDLSR